MARPLRVEYAGAFYHVINRGNSGEKIFKSKKDRERFLENLEKAVERFSLKVHTYCLMTNNYHLLVETHEPNLSKVIQWLNVSYAVYFNRKYKRAGHLFQGRFKSILVEADEYLKHLSRYIHLNPVRAKMVKKPSDFQWSSYRIFMGKDKPISWLETGRLLSQFGRRKKAAVSKYKDFVENVDSKSLGNPEKNLAGGFILGTDDFVTWVKETFIYARSNEKAIPQISRLKPVIGAEVIVDAVAEESGCSKEMILSRGRKRNIARDIAIYLARDLTGETGVKLGEFFGNISGSGITVRYNYLSNEMEKSKKLRTRINKLRKRIVNN